jgi:flagellar biogenesis protein FliO
VVIVYLFKALILGSPVIALIVFLIWLSSKFSQGE